MFGICWNMNGRRNELILKNLRDENDFIAMPITITYPMIDILHGALMLFGHVYAPAYNIPVGFLMLGQYSIFTDCI